MWKESVVVPVPKKPRTGPCIPDDFRGIALTYFCGLQSYVYCHTVIYERVVKVAEEKGVGVRGAMWIQEGERMQRSAADSNASGEDEDDS